jgi:hypothetical protein
MSDKTHAFVAGLRDLADFYEARQDLEVPHWPVISVCPVDTPEEARKAARLIGTARKEFADNMFILVRRFGPVELRFIFLREAVCTRRVVGTRHVPERYEPAREVEVVEWDCEPVLEEKALIDASLKLPGSGTFADEVAP